jgi:hypothetical protein
MSSFSLQSEVILESDKIQYRPWGFRYFHFMYTLRGLTNKMGFVVRLKPILSSKRGTRVSHA